MNQEITINLEGDSSYKFSMDLGSMVDLMDSFEDSTLVDTIVEKDIEINPFSALENPESIPDKIDTTLYFGNEDYIKDFNLTDREKELLNKFGVHLDVDKSQRKMLMEMVVSYKDIAERDSIMSAMMKMSAEKKRLEGDTTEVNEDGSQFFESMANYEVDHKLGIFTMLESAPPEGSGLENFKEEGEELDDETLTMIAMMMPGGITTRINFPSKVVRVEGIPYKQLSESSISVTHTYLDIIKNDVMRGYKVYFEPREAITDPAFTEVWDPEPLKVTPGKENRMAPSDAIVLLGDDAGSNWVQMDGSPLQWNVEDGVMTVKPGTGNIKTKEVFGDVQLHLEWRSPFEEGKEGQGLGNSGVFLQEHYEVQILNSYESRTYANGQAGAIYKQYPPAVNAMRPTGEWQSYDIIFHAPKFDQDGKKEESGTLTVLHNGVLIQDHKIIQGTTEYIGYPKIVVHEEGSIILQDHSNEVSFRNIWLRKL